MIATIHQPDFIPWIGFFDKIKKSDAYVILDDVQFSRTGWTHRDKFSSIENKLHWLTVPLKKKGNYFSKISEIEINYQNDWRDKHLTFLNYNFKNEYNFKKIISLIENIYSKKYEKLIELNVSLIKKILFELNIEREIFYSSDLNIQSNGSKKIIEILEMIKCKEYITGHPSKNYLKLDDFKKNNIKIIWYNSKDLNINDKLLNLSVLNYMFKNKVYDF
tara:strand:- start:133 stop:789 length:657 start_codon:yes stop_codon:yes gene_type:complete